MSLDVIWGTRSRGGSQFLVKLTTAALGQRLEPQSRLSGARKEGLKIYRDPSWDDFVEKGQPWDYFRHHGIKSLKVEEPAAGGFGDDLAREFARAKWLANYRRIEDIVVSHHNLRWGFPQGKLVKLMEQNLVFYERLFGMGRLFVVDIDDPSSFNLDAFCDFLDAEPSDELKAMASSWSKVNDLASLRASSGDTRTERTQPEDLGTLRTRFPKLDGLEARYRTLVEKSTGLTRGAAKRNVTITGAAL